MIKYKSTRGYKKQFTFSESVLKGIAPDGGLFVPEKIPQFGLSYLKNLQKKSYAEIADFVINLFETDFSKKEIQEMTKEAYGENFDNKEIAPVINLKNNQYIQELWHGPTSAFKDMALQLTPIIFEKAIEKNNKNLKDPLNYCILVATSGDTGKAALEGYKNKKNVKIVVLFPKDRVSKLQELAMTTQDGYNTKVFAVNGNFDDCQKLVKEIFDDKVFEKHLLNNFYVLSSGNSINWGRFLPQIVYHISGYLKLVKQKKINLGEKIDICIPTGNFGNILAAFVAKQMGLPVNKLICASNNNNVLTDFIKDGVYDLTKRKLIATSSPSIDILVASNLERLLYLLTKDEKKVAGFMKDLKENKKFSVDQNTKNLLKENFYSGWVSDKKSLENIKKNFDETRYLCDTHTSVAQFVAEKYIKEENVTIPVVINSTAHFAKFASAVYGSLFLKKDKDEFKMLEGIKKLSKIKIPKNIENLKLKQVLHKEVLNPDKKIIEDAITNKVL